MFSQHLELECRQLFRSQENTVKISLKENHISAEAWRYLKTIMASSKNNCLINILSQFNDNFQKQ